MMTDPAAAPVDPAAADHRARDLVNDPTADPADLLAEADQLLGKIALAWLRGDLARRDCKLEVGALCRRFVLTKMTAGDGMTERGRRAAGCMRKDCTAALAGRLGVSHDAINDMIRVSWVVELLAGPGGPGRLSWESLRWFRVVIERPPGRIRRSACQVMRDGVPIVDPSHRERRRICPAFEPWAADLFAGAREGCWPPDRVRTALADRVELRKIGPLVTGSPRSPSVREKIQAAGRRPVDLAEMAAQASPHDLADLIEKLIRSARDPGATVERLRAVMSRDWGIHR